MKAEWMLPAIDYYRLFFNDKANVVIDIGTRDGDDAKYISDVLNASEVYAVEARPSAAEETMLKYPSFHLSNIAISNFIGSTTFCSVLSNNKNLSGSSSFYNTKFVNPDYAYETITVEVTTMDQYLQDNGLAGEVIDFLKVDIEGYTWEFLEGFSNNLDNVKLLHLETETAPTHSNHKSNDKIKEFMESKNFLLAGVQYEWDGGIEDQVWINKKFIVNETERSKGRC